MRFVHWVMFAAFLTSSFDFFLVIKIGGTLHLAQVLMFVILLAGLAWVVQHHTVLWPRGGFALLIFTVCQGLLLFNSRGLLSINIELYLLFVFTVLGLYATLQLYGRSRLLPHLFYLYLLSFVIIGIFGAVQFTMPILHLGGPFVTQWIKHGSLARINGFNSEPSYFATYLIMGMIMLIDLRITGARITAGHMWRWAAILLTAVFFLSTSKTAWLILIVELVLRGLPYVWGRLIAFLTYISYGRVIIRRPRPWIPALALVLVLAIGAGLTALASVVPLLTFLNGTGLGNTAAHSLNDRTTAFVDTVAVFREHPWLGPSLGGVAPEIALRHGVIVTSAEDQKLYWGFPVPMDALAASGIPVFLPFLWFFLIITLGERKLIKQHWADDRAKWLHALIRALAFEWLILLGDQYLIRVYFWFHVTMVVIVGYSLRYVPSLAQLPPADDANAAPTREESLVAA